MMKKSSHPWLNEKGRNAIQRKNATEGTDSFISASADCFEVLNKERKNWVDQTKKKLASLPKSSKQWWRLNRDLMRRKANISSIPALREGTQWLTDAKSKANAFAKVFSSKAHLPEEAIDTPFFGEPNEKIDSLLIFRSRVTKRLLKKLDGNKATGLDQISASILKELHDCIAIPFTHVVRRLFYEACWPKIWRHHMIVPIFKRGAAFQPGNYRGVHLTTVLSKVAEKMIGLHLVPFLRKTAFGDNQWAFTAGIGSRDLVTMLLMSWILNVCLDKKVGAYLSDISGAFDRVFKPYLLSKLHGFGVGDDFLNFLDSYLAPRTGQICVQGEYSEIMQIENSVYQGTVLGPPLWNSFFSDVAVPASSAGGKEAMFADDLNVFHTFDRHVPLTEVTDILERCRSRVHKWGTTNRVSFDASKEHLVVLHPSLNHGPSFKLLGCMVDPDLRMHSCIEQVLSKIRPKVTAILRMRGFYSVPELVQQFKTHIWGLVEMHSGGFFHAASSLLEKLDHVQNRFLRELNVSPCQAFLEFNFAPPSLRRNIGALGLLHKRVLGKAHPTFEKLLPWYTERFPEGRSQGHNKQLYGHHCEIRCHNNLFFRSIFAVCDVYNNLPQHVVDLKTIKDFQRYLTQVAKMRCQQGVEAWASSFCRRSEWAMNNII